jgi:hypothetical protein
MTNENIRQAVIGTLEALDGLRDADSLARLRSPGGDMPIKELALESLDAIEWCMEIEERTGVEVDPADFQNIDTISDLIELVAARAETRQPVLPQSATKLDNAFPPLSVQQRRIWHSIEAAGSNSGYVIPNRHTIRGRLDVDRLVACVNEIVRRHDILRTTFDVVNGQPVQIVHPMRKVEVPLHVIAEGTASDAEVRKIIGNEMAKMSNLKTGPLARFLLLRVAENEHQLVRVWHHILHDAAAEALFFNEFQALYDAMERGEAPSLPQFSQYSAYAVKQADEQARSRADAVAWLTREITQGSYLAAPPLAWPQPKTNISVDESSVRGPVVDTDMHERLNQLKATVYNRWLACFVAQLVADSGQRKVLIGTYVSGRRRLEFQNTIGDFANVVPLMLECDRAASFRELLARVEAQVVQATTRSEILFEDICADLRANRIEPPSIQMIFAAPLAFGTRDWHFAGIEVTRKVLPGSAMPWGFTLNVGEKDGHLYSHMGFDANRFDPAKVQRFAERFHRLMDAVSRNPDAAVDALC